MKFRYLVVTKDDFVNCRQLIYQKESLLKEQSSKTQILSNFIFNFAPHKCEEMWPRSYDRE